MVITKPTLLIVDDDDSIRNTLALIFVELGYCVRSASDGFAALALIHESEPDILISDLNMPGMSVFELLSVVRRIYPAISVIATRGAFSGKSVPHRVAADASYEKGTGQSSLFDAIKRSAQSDRAIRRSTNGSTSIWIAPKEKLSSDELYILRRCPHCLRTFPRMVAGSQPLVCETECRYCGALICYAIAPLAESAAVTNSNPFSSAGPIDIDDLFIGFDVPDANLHYSNWAKEFVEVSL